MSATKYNLTLVGVNKMSPALKGAAADAGDLTSVLRQQRVEAKKLNATQKDLGKYTELRKGLAATRQGLKSTQESIKGLAVEQSQAKSVVAALAHEKKLAARKVERLAAAIDKAGVPTAAMSEEFRLAKLRASQLGDQLEEEQAQLVRIGQKFELAKTDARELKEAFNDQRNQLHKLGNELREAGVDTGNFAREQARLKREVENSNKALEAQKVQLKNLKAARSRMAAADARMNEVQSEAMGAAALMATAVIPLTRAVKMEAAMADVSKVTQFEGSEKAEFQSQLQRLAVEVNVPPEQLTKIAAAAGQSGIDKEDLAGFTAAASRMGVAFDMEAAEAGETMAAWRAGMGLNQQKAEQLADAVNHVSNNMNAKAKDISGVLQRQGAVATASGMTETQTASLAGALLAGGASEEVAATTMKNLLGALTKGDAATSSQKTALSSLGLDSENLAYSMQTDSVATVKEVFDALADAPLEKQSALISQIFGEESKGGIMPLLKNQKLLQQAFELTADKNAYHNSALEEYKNRASVTEHRLGSAWRSIDRLGIVLGDSILPVVGPIADGVGWVAGGLADLAEAGGTATTVITGAAAAYVTFKAGMFAWQLASAKVEQWRAKSALTTAEKETRLAMATDDTAKKAGLATRALDRFNDALGRTGRLKHEGGSRNRRAADTELPESRGRRDSGDGRDSPDSRRRRAGGRRGRMARLAGRGVATVKNLGAMAVDHTLELFSGAAGIAGLVSLAGLVGSHWSGAGGESQRVETVDRSFVDQAGALVSGVVNYAVERIKTFMGSGSRAAALMSPGVFTDAMDTASDLAGTASDVLGSLASTVAGGAANVLGMAAKAVRPIDTLLQSGNLVAAVAEGDVVETASTVGDIAGGWGGAAGGAAAGAAIGSFVPIIGTGIGAAIGAGLGGWFGGEGGSWLATQAVELFHSENSELEGKASDKTLMASTSSVSSSALISMADQSETSDSDRSLVSKVMGWFRSDNSELEGKASDKTLMASTSSESSSQSNMSNALIIGSDKTLSQRLAEADQDAGKVITSSALQQVHNRVQQEQKSSQVATTEQAISFNPQITINAPAGSNVEQVADLAVQKMKDLFNSHLLPALNPTLPGRIDDSMEIMS